MQARLALRFKLQQGSPVRAMVLLDDGIWHVGSTMINAAGGGCTVPGASRADGTWERTTAFNGFPISGTSITKGRFQTDQNLILLTDIKESWFPGPNSRSKVPEFEDKPIEGQYLCSLDGGALLVAPVVDNAIGQPSTYARVG